MRNSITRRRFFQQAPAFAGAAAPAQSPRRWSPGEPFRIGCLNVSTYSHLADLWAPFMNPRAGRGETPLTGMRITHCWEIEPDKAEAFAKTYGCQAVRNFDDMLGKVDGIISGGYYNYPWNHILHQPYLEAGLPNLINRPFADTVAKTRRILDLAQKHNAAILVPSAFEYTEAITRAKSWAHGKKILCYTATNSFDDYPSHGVHGVYLISKAVAEAGNPVVSVAYQAKQWWTPPGVMTFEHADPSGRSFFGALHQVSGSWGTIQIHTPEEYGGKNFLIRTGVEFPFNKTEVWAPTIWAFQNMAMNQAMPAAMPQTYDQILHKTNVFLAGFHSILANDGKPVRLDQVPDDWHSPVELPDRPGDPTVSLFIKKFGKP
ncbi:MAG TPA: Gfo/Idh/MocA family oxidoreductase [Bryobacterales bacterium]|nr:Gfo/Idh/MocA family oxidoreductase [Bryobacterales bacterium]